MELHDAEPAERYGSLGLRTLGLRMLAPHPRARVWAEERHRYLPPWALRTLYRRILAPPIGLLSARGSRES